MCGPQRHVVGQGEQPLHRRVLGARQLLDTGRVDQVGAGRRPDDERPTGEHTDRFVTVEQQEREVFVRVTGGHQRPQPEPAQVDLVAVRQPGVWKLPPACRGREDGRAVGGGQVERAGEEVSVQVRVGREGHREPVARSGRS